MWKNMGGCCGAVPLQRAAVITLASAQARHKRYSHLYRACTIEKKQTANEEPGIPAYLYSMDGRPRNKSDGNNN